MDDIFTAPLSIIKENNDSAKDFSSTLSSRPLSGKEQIRIALPYFCLMTWMSFMVFYIPGAFPYQTNSDLQYLLLNTVFLIFPALGAALTNVIKIHYLFIITIIQVSFYIFLNS